MLGEPEVEASLEAIAARVRSSSPFDLSPRGIRFRPDAELTGRIDSVARAGDSAVPMLAARLETTVDAFIALVWLYLLIRIRTPAAEAAIRAFVDRVEREESWSKLFPGRREILLFLGRSTNLSSKEPAK